MSIAFRTSLRNESLSSCLIPYFVCFTGTSLNFVLCIDISFPKTACFASSIDSWFDKSIFDCRDFNLEIVDLAISRYGELNVLHIIKLINDISDIIPT